MVSSDADPDHTKLSPFLVCAEGNCGVNFIGRFLIPLFLVTAVYSLANIAKREIFC